MKIKLFCLLAVCFYSVAGAQPDRWQQRVKYTMNIDMNVQTNRFTGKQKLEYWNNSPDTLTKVFYHLYFNAFQPGSMMDTRSRRQGSCEWQPVPARLGLTCKRPDSEPETRRNWIPENPFIENEWTAAGI